MTIAILKAMGVGMRIRISTQRHKENEYMNLSAENHETPTVKSICISYLAFPQKS